MTATLRARVFHALEGDEPGRNAHPVAKAIAVLILLNLVAIVLESVESVRLSWGVWLDAFEWATVGVFTLEYLARIWACTSDPRYAHAVGGRLRYALTPFAVVDVVAILPTYVAFALGATAIDLTMLRALRLLRLFRVLKLGRYSEASRIFSRVFNDRRHELGITAGIAIVFLVITSSVMYEAEHDAQPDKFPHIPAAMWWGVVTLGTVGYGDVFPVTPLGKLMAGLSILVGIALVAMPTAIIAGGFLEELERRKQEASPCPHCGKKETDPVEGVRVAVAEGSAPSKRA